MEQVLSEIDSCFYFFPFSSIPTRCCSPRRRRGASPRSGCSGCRWCWPCQSSPRSWPSGWSRRAPSTRSTVQPPTPSRTSSSVRDWSRHVIFFLFLLGNSDYHADGWLHHAPEWWVGGRNRKSVSDMLACGVKLERRKENLYGTCAMINRVAFFCCKNIFFALAKKVII